MNYWYAPLHNEMFLDLDSKAALMRAMRVLHVWMKEYKKYDLPPIEAIYNYPTSHRDGRYHAHVIVVFEDEDIPFGLSTEWRALLACWMGSDARRTCYVLARLRETVYGDEIKDERFCDLLRSKRPYYRDADYLCECKGKHKDRTITDKCKALKKMLGKERSADYFPRVGPGKIPALQIPVGEIPLNVIRQWRE